MKLIITYCFVIFTIINYSIFSQTPKLIGPPGGFVRDNLIAVHPQDPNIIYTSTWSGAIFRSNIFDNTILPIETGFRDFQASQIALPDKELDFVYIYLFGHSLKSTDAGASWDVLLESDFKPYFSFNPLNSDIVFMARDNYELWRSNDKGNTWFILKTFTKPVRRIAVAPTDTSIIYVAVDMEFHKSTNSGNDWFMTFDTTGWWQTYKMIVNPYNKNSIYYRIEGALYKSTDGGVTIESLLSPGVSAFVLNPLDTLILYASSGDPFFAPDGGIVKTTDGGDNWFSVVNGIPGEFITATSMEINLQNPDELYAGIGDLGVFKTTDGGENWMLSNLSYIDVINIYVDPNIPGHLISGQYGWGVLKTTTDGDTWVQPQFDTDFQELECRDFTFNPDDKKNGFLAAHVSLFKTIDYGNTWVATNQLPGVKSISYHPMDSNILLAAGKIDIWNPSFIYRSTDGGDNWNFIGNYSAGYYVFHPSDINIIYTTGGKKILKSSDIGETWSAYSSGLAYSEPGSIAQVSSIAIYKDYPQILYCGQKGGFSKSTNGGENWFQIDSALEILEPSLNVSSILLDKYTPGRIYVGILDGGMPSTAGFTQGGLYLTEDDGQNWKRIFEGKVKVIKADNSTPRNIYFGTKFGIMKIVDTFHVTSVQDIEEITPSDYKLFQNYPNPFNPATIIKYQIPHNSHVTIKVYDILGKEITTLVNKDNLPGRYKVEFTGEGLPSGVYFYKIQSGNFVEVKKMLLLR